MCLAKTESGGGEVLDRKQINVMRQHAHWRGCMMRSKAEPMQEVADLVRRDMEGIMAWAQTGQTNGFLEAINGLFLAAKRRARGFPCLSNRHLPDCQQARLTRVQPARPTHLNFNRARKIDR